MSETDIIASFLLVAQIEEADILGSLVLMAGVEEADMIGGSLIAARKSVFVYWRHIWRTVDSSLGLVAKTQLLLQCAVAYRSLTSWLAKADDPVFAPMIERHPLTPALRRRPYLNTLWSTRDRTRVLETHYAMLRDLRVLAFPFDASVLLADLRHIEPGLTLELDKPIWFGHEGEVAINFFSGGERIYSLLFTLGEIDSTRVAYVGAVQGRSLPDAVERYKRLTRAAHGMRPRDFLFAAFRLLCAELAVDRILAVSDRANIARSGYFKSSNKVHAQHDETWSEYGGVPVEPGFFELPVTLKIKVLEEIPSKKRAQYRRRYETLQAMQAELAHNVRNFRWQKVVQMGPEVAPRDGAE